MARCGPGSGTSSRTPRTSPAACAAPRRRSPRAAGRLLEGFVAGELRKQLGWSEESATMYHYRDRNGPSVDLVLETPDGRVAGIQVKAGSTVTSTDTRWLSVLREELGERFVAGVVLHTGQTAVSVSDRVWARASSKSTLPCCEGGSRLGIEDGQDA